MILLEMRDVIKEYDGVLALKGISLKVKKGRSLGIVGPNGSGKTTLLKLMAMLDKPTSGKIFYKGVGVDDVASDLRGKITMVFQKAVFFDTTVYENIAYGLRLRGWPEVRVKRKVMCALNMVGLRDHAGRMAKRLSGGEQQRAALARALVLEPELLLLDEPTANLDATNTKIVETIIKKIKGKSTVVLATNDIFQALRLTDRIAYLLDGRLIAEGEASEVFRRSDARIGEVLRGCLPWGPDVSKLESKLNLGSRKARSW
jgi:tungstate transport system ATP-binding protein